MLERILETAFTPGLLGCESEYQHYLMQLETSRLARQKFIAGEIDFATYIDILELCEVDIDSYLSIIESNLIGCGVRI